MSDKKTVEFKELTPEMEEYLKVGYQSCKAFNFTLFEQALLGNPPTLEEKAFQELCYGFMFMYKTFILGEDASGEV